LVLLLTDRLVVGRNVTLTLTTERLVIGRKVTLTLTLTVFQKRIMFGGAESAQHRPAESVAGETSQQPEARPERTETTEHRERNGTLSHGNLFTEPIQREPVKLADSTGTYLPSRSHRNLFTEPILREPVKLADPREPVYRVDPTGTC
jgi:hypothetical protein